MRDPGQMSTTTTRNGALDLVRVQPDDAAAVAVLTDFYNAARLVDDPDTPAAVPSIVAGNLAYGWDLDPDETAALVDKHFGELHVLRDIDDDRAGPARWPGLRTRPPDPLDPASSSLPR